MKISLKPLLASFLILLALFGHSQKNYLYQIGEEYTIPSRVLGEERTIWVQVPADAKPYEKFPVAFVLDGGEHMSALASVYHYYWGDHLPRMILVGIANRENRMRDLTTSEAQLDGIETGGADNFAEFITKELIPYVEDNFSATSYRTLIGHSLAGLFTTYMLIDHPEVFNNYIAIDPALDWDNQALLNTASEKLMNADLTNKSFFMSLASPLDRSDASVGVEEVRESTSEFSIMARANLSFLDMLSNYPDLMTSWKYYLNDIHSTVPLPSIIDGLIQHFSWFRLENVDKINNPETTVEELERIFEYRSSKLRAHFGYDAPPADEEMLNMGGYMFLQMDQIEKAGFLFKLAVKSYPESVNAHDSLAEYYEATGKTDDALSELSKAFELSGEQKYRDWINRLKSRKN